MVRILQRTLFPDDIVKAQLWEKSQENLSEATPSTASTHDLDDPELNHTNHAYDNYADDHETSNHKLEREVNHTDSRRKDLDPDVRIRNGHARRNLRSTLDAVS